MTAQEPQWIQKGSFKAIIYPIEADEQTLFEQLTASQKEQFKQANFASSRRRKEWMAVRMALKALCGSEKEIAYLPSGKPYLVDQSAQISISHTAGFVAVAIDKIDSIIGIDIEYRSDRVTRIASRFMSDAELKSLSLADPQTHLLLHWSAKESLFKAMGIADLNFKTELRIAPFVLQDAGSFEGWVAREGVQRRFLIWYVVELGFVVTWCLES